MPIKLLDPEVVSRIAAGEVVERPASVVKELVENSLDAASTQITVEVAGGGVNLIRVTDNGVGIPAAELGLAFQRYATSKISRIEDLESILSLGFRGEALASIAAVSQVDIVTCAAGDSSGSYLSVKEGVAAGKGSRGRSQGTTVTVRNLFRNIPARLKFLKSPNTENSHIASVVSQYALAFPEVKFTLVSDGRTALNTPGSGRLMDTVIEVYGLDVARNLLEISREEKAWKDNTETSLQVTGMVGSPAISRSNRSYLSFFVNRRWINSRILTVAVEEAYHGMLMTGKHPVAIINIAVPARELDVNIHPTKTEIKFRDERMVFSAVQKAVRRALIEMAPAPRIEEIATAYKEAPAPAHSLWTPAVAGRQVESAEVQPLPQAFSFSLPALRLLGQLSGSYIVAEGPDGLYLIDQHAAHERILFEKVREQFARHDIEVQGLLEPATLEVDPRQDAVLRSHYEELAGSGFAVEPFGERTYLVRTVPVLLHNKDWVDVLKEILDSPAGDRGDWTERVAISIACHSAIRAGQVLTGDEMRELIRQLEQVALPNSCPHGRPTMIHLSAGQLEKEFGRRA